MTHFAHALKRPLAAACLLGISALLSSPSAHAHKASDAYLNYRIEGTRVSEQVDVALRDLDRDLALDTDQDGRITWSELRPLAPALRQWLDQGVGVQVQGQACTPDAAAPPLQVDHHSDGAYAVLRRAWQCPEPVRSLQLDYRLFTQTDPLHRGLARVESGTMRHTAVLGPQQPTQGFELASAAAPVALGGDFVLQGMHHILEGLDHVLFLCVLLLPAVLVWRPAARASAGPADAVHPTARPWRPAQRGALAWPASSVMPLARAGTRNASGAAGWAPAPAWRPVVKNLLQVVTAFTLAHSITLTLAVLGWLTLPSRWVESCVAATVLLAALNNLRPVVRDGRWALTFAFGLIHGLAFAGALSDLGLHGMALLRPLLSFNLGIELGQLVIVALFLPLAWRLRASTFYRQAVLKGGSIAVALLAAVWCVERALDLRILP